MSGTVLADKGAVWATNNHLLQDPGTGNAFVQNGLADAVAVVGAGTYKLPDYGLPQYVRATGAVTITNAAGTTVATLASGDIAYFLPTSTTAWKCASHSGLLTSALTTQGFIDLPLTTWREVATNDIAALATAGTTGSGGVLATDTTPALEFANGDTDSQIRLAWAASNVDAITRQITLPPDLDRTANIVLNVRGAMSDANDAAVIALDTFFDEGDTKVEDNTGSISDTEVVNETATIAAADIPDTATTMSIELTPGAHANDAMYVYAIWLTYTKKLLTS